MGWDGHVRTILVRSQPWDGLSAACTCTASGSTAEAPATKSALPSAASRMRRQVICGGGAGGNGLLCVGRAHHAEREGYGA